MADRPRSFQLLLFAFLGSPSYIFFKKPIPKDLFMKNTQILIVENNRTMRDGIQEILERRGFQTSPTSSTAEALSIFRDSRNPIVITDYKIDEKTGIDLLQELKALSDDVEVILITAYPTVDIAVEAMRLGASDFVSKPFSPDELCVKVEKCLKSLENKNALRQKTEENRYLKDEISSWYNFGNIVGRSDKMQEVYSQIKKVANSDTSVIIYGESGTGKELVARAIHQNSARAEKPFVKVNCSALTETLLESELFGHERGAFTGAVKSKKGRFELANEGTMFLDEIGEVSANVQVKLLRVLQEKEFERVGGEQSIKVDVRIISATNRDLYEAFEREAFREDLYYRLNVFPIKLPPLREHKEDIPELVEFFLRRLENKLGHRGLTVEEAVIRAFQQYDWNGNVRELENILERAIVLSDGQRITLDNVPLPLKFSNSGPATSDPYENMELNDALETLERKMIKDALNKTSGVKAEAAKILGIKPATLHYKLEKYGLLDT